MVSVSTSARATAGARCATTCCARDWDGGVTGAAIDYPGSDTHTDAVVFGTESIDVPVRVTLYSAVGSATIVGTGNGRYEVR